MLRRQTEADAALMGSSAGNHGHCNQVVQQISSSCSLSFCNSNQRIFWFMKTNNDKNNDLALAVWQFNQERKKGGATLKTSQLDKKGHQALVKT